MCVLFFRCSHDARNKLGARLTGAVKTKGPIKGLLKKMGSKLSCSCGPLKIKGGYRFNEPHAGEPFNTRVATTAGVLSRRSKDGHLLK